MLAGESVEGGAHGTSDIPAQGPPKIDGAIDAAHSPTATSPVIRTDPTVDPTVAQPPSRPDSPTEATESSPDDEPDPFTQARKRRWAELIRHVWLDDPEICEQCGGRMRIAGVCTSPRDDDAIRQELQTRGAWDPPWARAPPKIAPSSLPPPLAESTHPELDPWDDEWIPDPWFIPAPG